MYLGSVPSCTNNKVLISLGRPFHGSFAHLMYCSTCSLQKGGRFDGSLL